ncbi:MAG TPA: hypothetical protein VJT50_06925 [Pyrinomonadaceae bacterium]|nr:hypothetical protein [Pyrinomonadaceae bacterium]
MAIKHSNDLQDEIAGEIIRIMPQLPQVMRRTLRRAEHFDTKQPATTIENIKKDFESLPLAIGNGSPEVAEKLIVLLSSPDASDGFREIFKDVVKTLKQQAARDARYSQLLKLMAEADARIPFISIIVSLRHGDPVDHIVSQCAPIDLLERASKTRGEERATAILRALDEITELLYRRYVITIWQLSFFKNNAIPPSPPSTGNLIRQAYERLHHNYPTLIEPDAGWLRNSAEHNPRKYLPHKDVVLMWDRNVPAIEVRVDDLVAIANRMYSISATTIQRVAQLYMLRNTLLNTGLLDSLLSCLRDLTSADVRAQRAAEERLIATARIVTAPLEAFFNSH